jgi:hypothetical protein
MMASRYAHAKQFKRHHRQLRLLRSRLGRIIRDIRRKITGRPELEAVFEAPIARAAQIRSQRQRQRGWKLYSFHAPRSNASSMKGCGSSGCRRAEVRSGSKAVFEAIGKIDSYTKNCYSPCLERVEMDRRLAAILIADVVG